MILSMHHIPICFHVENCMGCCLQSLAIRWQCAGKGYESRNARWFQHVKMCMKKKQLDAPLRREPLIDVYIHMYIHSVFMFQNIQRTYHTLHIWQGHLVRTVYKRFCPQLPQMFSVQNDSTTGPDGTHCQANIVQRPTTETVSIMELTMALKGLRDI